MMADAVKLCKACGAFRLIDGFTGVCLSERTMKYITDECTVFGKGNEGNTNKTNTVLKKGD